VRTHADEVKQFTTIVGNSSLVETVRIYSIWYRPGRVIDKSKPLYDFLQFFAGYYAAMSKTKPP